jgi:outer membrane protein assembly factor BamA
VGGGVIVSFSRRTPGLDPFLYRIELVSMTMFKSLDGSLRVPYMDNYVDVSLPHLLEHKLKLQVRAAYTRESTIKYYGVGNASALPRDRSLNDPMYAYFWQHPGFTGKLSEHIAGPLWLVFQLGYTYNDVRVRDGTKLDADRKSGVACFKASECQIRSHSDLTLGYGAEIDTRDHEVSPTDGQYDTVRLALSPGGASGFSEPWVRFDASVRGYIPVAGDSTVIALRGTVDALFGEPPIYELARYDDIGLLGTGALGGPNGIRGIPAQRYHGKLKLFGNVELRSYFWDFHFLDKINRLGFVVFADVGRVWAEYASHPELDGTGLGLKYGLGAGLRLLGGKTFVLRVDLAWSPDARPIGGYLAAGNAF